MFGKAKIVILAGQSTREKRLGERGVSIEVSEKVHSSMKTGRSAEGAP